MEVLFGALSKISGMYSAPNAGSLQPTGLKPAVVNISVLPRSKGGSAGCERFSPLYRQSIGCRRQYSAYISALKPIMMAGFSFSQTIGTN